MSPPPFGSWLKPPVRDSLCGTAADKRRGPWGWHDRPDARPPAELTRCRGRRRPPARGVWGRIERRRRHDVDGCDDRAQYDDDNSDHHHRQRVAEAAEGRDLDRERRPRGRDQEGDREEGRDRDARRRIGCRRRDSPARLQPQAGRRRRWHRKAHFRGERAGAVRGRARGARHPDRRPDRYSVVVAAGSGAPTNWPPGHPSASTGLPGLTIPRSPVIPPAASSPAQISITRWKASTDSLLRAKVSPAIEPATTMPMSETPMRPATRATALLIAEAMPASLSPASASTAAVSGATATVRPKEKMIRAGSRSFR